MKKILLYCLFIFLGLRVSAQQTFPVNGVADIKPNKFALIDACIYVDAHTRLPKATLLIDGDKIVSISEKTNIPAGYVAINCLNKIIYPGFIDAYTSYGLSDTKNEGNSEDPIFISTKDGAYHWNEAVKSEYNAIENFSVKHSDPEVLRSQGFTVVNTLKKDGIFRGTSALVSLGSERDNLLIISANAASALSFRKGSSKQDYPSSLMGSIALIRQSYYDAKWLKENKGKVEFNQSLQAINDQQSKIKIFEVTDVHDIFRAQKIADEFNINYVFKGAGNEYQRIPELKKINPTIIIGLNFPKIYDVEDYFDAGNISLTELKNWELAPSNPAALANANIKFLLSTSDLKKPAEFLNNLRKAVKYGLSEESALTALTETPAMVFGVNNQVGSLKKGMRANFLVCSGNIFKEESATILSTWIDGKSYTISSANENDIRGTYQVTNGNIGTKEITIKGTLTDLVATGIKADSTDLTIKLNFFENQVSMIYDPSIDSNSIGKFRLNASFVGNQMIGSGTSTDGSQFNWSANKIKTFQEPAVKNEKIKKDNELQLGPVYYPFTAYGNTSSLQAEKMLIKNATIWTNESPAILTETDVLINKGKIVQIGKNIQALDAKVIDASGKYLTSGIIDEHSHIAITRGVNEGTQSNTAEVSIGDALDPDDINIYRQLAGGVTTSHLLHGSANPIGGQSAVIKLRWGKMAEELKFEGASPFIKFALGENVKQSNWGDRQQTRFPQTRMGVEQVYIDAFTRAREYESEKLNYSRLSTATKSKTISPRFDLELETMLEILNKKRFITCHSYVQSEINMLMHVADSFQFKVNTFTHILEGYKVADKMKAHGANASTFSDWWAYKFEVMDAIPYNAAILTKVGVNTAINSDDAEMARRLNQEAAKAIKYGALTEIEAWKLVTLNPAKMLHIDHRVGSIKVGKDADVVLWNTNPLTIDAKPEKTIIDGVIYFDTEIDLQLRNQMAKEKERLIQKMLDLKKVGMPSQKVTAKEKKLYHCDDMEHEMSN
ncbi:MAG: amidohydrolase family protein [Sphingobacteriaceae bacterium]